MRTPRFLLLSLVGLVASWATGCADDDKKPSIARPIEDAARPPPPLDAAPDAWVEPDLGPDPEPEPTVDGGVLPDAAPAPVQVVAVDTRLGAEATVAGVENRVTCVALAADESPVDEVTTRVEVRPGEGWARGVDDETALVGEVAGVYQVTCTAPMLGLRDTTPAAWEVRPAEAVEVRATVEPSAIVAGEFAEVRCEAVDAFGNPVDTAGATVSLSPEGAGVFVDGRVVEVQTAGRYEVACVLGGATSQTARLDVTPGLPSQIVARVVPEAPVYRVGEVVGYAVTVTDTFGNRVDDAALVWGSEPSLPAFGAGRYLATEEGRYTLAVRVDGPTLGDVPLEASAEILVDAGGPAITCDQPGDGAMVRRTGAPVALGGEVRDIAGLAAFEVDGEAVAVDAAGRFAVERQPAWGLNVHTLVARDAFGNENSTLCTYFAADDYIGEDALLFDGVALQLSQGAVDDGAPNRPIASLGDLLRGVLDSPELVATVDAALRAQNPVVPNRCLQRIPNPFGDDPCLFTFGAEYRSIEIRGPNSLAMPLLAGGIRFQVVIRGIRISMRTTGTASVGGLMTADSVGLDITFNVGLENGRPAVTLRGVNNIAVGGLDLDLDGGLGSFFDPAVDLVFGAFEGLVRDELVNAIRGFLEGELDDLLSGILDGLDINALGLAFDVPTLDGSAPIRLSLGVAFDQVQVAADRLRIGISTRAQGPTRQAAPSAGVPLVVTPSRINLAPQGTMAGAVSLGLINQVLHRLWRGGFFAVGDAGAVLGDLPEGTSIGLEVRVPPAVEGIGDNRVRLHLGPAVASIAYAGLFDDPLRIRLAATLTAGVELRGGTELVFGAVEIETLRLVIEGVQVTAQAREVIERDLRRIVQAVADQALNDLLPTVPIPDFALPESLVQYGVPRGTRLGLRQATLSGQRAHFVLDGRFGE